MSKEFSRGEFRALTGIRGVAAVFVALYHFKIYEFFSGASRTFLHHGYLSVDLFFILSGFIMSYTYAHLFRDGFNWKGFSVFLSRRIARVYPLYIAISAIFMMFLYLRLGHPPKNSHLELMPALANIAMVQSWGIARSYLAVGWSISTEWAAYLIFPVLASITLFCRRAVATATGVVCCILLGVVAFVPGELTGILKFKGPLDISEPTNYGPLARCLIEFTLGLLSFRYFQGLPATSKLFSRWSSAIIAAAMTVLLFIPDSDFFAVLLVPFFILSLTNDDAVFSKLLAAKPVHMLGVLSYSIYLVHFLTIVLKRRLLEFLQGHHVPLAELVVIAIQCGMTFAFAVVTYNLIEKPGRRLLRAVFEPGRKINPEPQPNLSAP